MNLSNGQVPWDLERNESSSHADLVGRLERAKSSHSGVRAKKTRKKGKVAERDDFRWEQGGAI